MTPLKFRTVQNIATKYIFALDPMRKDILSELKKGPYLHSDETGGDDWFTAPYYDGVPLQNNHAERELRLVVLLRKTIGCYRNWKGKRRIDVVMSVVHTWELQGKNLFKNLRALAI